MNPGESIEIRRGVEKYQTKAGFTALRIHYSSSRKKDPARPEGARWKAEELRGYPGGEASSAWRQEQEIDWDAAGGEKVFPEFPIYKDKIVVTPFTVPETWSLYGSFDYGTRNPSSFHIHALDHDGDVWTVWEFYQSGLGYRDIARRVRACPFFDRLSFLPICDPSIGALNQQTQDNVIKSIKQLFSELPESERIWFADGKKGGDVTVAERILGDLWKDLDKNPPRWRIFKTCPMLIWEIEHLRWADWSETQSEYKNFREEIVDKDNHAWDDFKMFLMMFFMAPDRPKDKKWEKLREIDPVAYREWTAMEARDNARQSGGFGEFE